ncbi:lytic transglycosylase domain-containing protein [Jannaschia sp. CCS1]|uniref:lytic transglycosylase domain-containing protein n=1 Tax=Jannaschia sp. (strain CCS1) TaxID=290400 RepID=UPI000053B11C|nr:lytic transglycosylase domain-containing protein [Jannaschia sp. CCS1]ABD54803.1 Lytic transglycosylase catalytic [Jannaschia sp. CCS1]
MSRFRLSLAAVCGVLFALPATAQSGLDRLDRAMGVLDGRAATQYEFSDRLRPTSEAERGLPEFEGGYDGPFLEVARSAARRHGVPEDLFLRLVQQESGWNTGALSSAGAIGLAQLMPDTATLLGVDPADPVANLDGGARYLAQQFRRFGNWRLALAAYNAGPEAVVRHDGVPPFAETQHYVRVILGTRS